MSHLIFEKSMIDIFWISYGLSGMLSMWKHFGKNFQRKQQLRFKNVDFEKQNEFEKLFGLWKCYAMVPPHPPDRISYHQTYEVPQNIPPRQVIIKRLARADSAKARGHQRLASSPEDSIRGVWGDHDQNQSDS